MGFRSVSLIIPSHNRAGLLSKVLRAIQAQTRLPEGFELIVVLDGCKDDSLAVVQSCRAGFPIKCFELPGLGPASARNFGAEQANGDLLIFLDDDVEPGPNFIQAHVAAHEATERALVLGPYLPVPRPSSDLFRQLQARWWRDHFERVAAVGHRFTYRDVLAGNFSIAKSLWWAIGGLDPSFRKAREDIEFGVRAIASGVTISFAPEARAAHHEAETMSLKGSVRRAFEEGYSDILLGQKHPSLQPYLAAYRHGRRSDWVEKAARHGSAIGDLCAGLLVRLLPAVGALGLRGEFIRLYRRLTRYRYIRGCLSHAEPSKRARVSPSSARAGSAAAVLELSQGLHLAEAYLDGTRPERVDLLHRGILIGELPYEPGAEAWAGRHLRPYLARHYGPVLIAAMAQQGDIDGLTDCQAARVAQRVDRMLHFNRARSDAWAENASQWREFGLASKARLGEARYGCERLSGETTE